MGQEEKKKQFEMFQKEALKNTLEKSEEGYEKEKVIKEFITKPVQEIIEEIRDIEKEEAKIKNLNEKEEEIEKVNAAEKEVIYKKQDINKNKFKKMLIVLFLFLLSLGGIYSYKELKPKKSKAEKINLANPNAMAITDIKDDDEDELNLLKKEEIVKLPSSNPAVAYEMVSKKEYEKRKLEQENDKDIEEIDKEIENITNTKVVNSVPKKSQQNDSMSFYKMKNAESNNATTLQEKIRKIDNAIDLSMKNVIKNGAANMLMQGSIIPAILITQINTDIQGDVIAQVKENVYDTKTGDILLIPKGSKLYGKYSSEVQNGQSRVLILFEKLILPNGKYVELSNMNATDGLGAGGITDKVNKHTLSLIGNAIFSSLLNFGNTMAESVAFNVKGINIGLSGTKSEGSDNSPFKKATGKILERAVDRKPTLTIRKGFTFNILINNDVLLEPYEY